LVGDADNNRPRIPAIAVASGPYIFIYRNFRPHYKFTVPAIEIDAQETKLWEALAKCTIEVPDALTQLLTMRYQRRLICHTRRSLQH
jgi:Bardet-Biedl syndrome 1 protein